MDGYIATILGWAPNFAPRAWAFCEGQLLAISSNTALFSLIGTIYGGDGRTTFQLPDLRGRTPIGAGTGPGLSTYPLGARGGQETVTLTIPEIPSHNHAAGLSSASVAIPASTADGNTDTPSSAVHLAKGSVTSGLSSSPAQIYNNSTPDTTLGGPMSISGSVAVGLTGGSQSHENRQPFLAIYWIICLQGVFPSRS